VADIDGGFEIPARLVDVVAKQMYGRAMRRRSYETGWYDLTKEQRKVWLEDATAIVEPMYREIADDLEKRMMQRSSIERGVAAFNRANRGRGEGTQPIEESIHAAYRAALAAPAAKRTLAQAIKRLAQAGRELRRGYGAAEAADRVGPGELALRKAGLDESQTPAIALGVAIGLLMAGDAEAEQALAAIFDDWQLEQEPAA
jgi:hypothetical protein